jgi:hypothetical protein
VVGEKHVPGSPDPPLWRARGIPENGLPRPVTTRHDGTLLATVQIAEDFSVSTVALWVSGKDSEWYGGAPSSRAFSAGYHLKGTEAEIAEFIADAGRAILERAEDVEALVADATALGHHVPPATIGHWQRRVGILRLAAARAVVVATVAENILPDPSEAYGKALGTLQGELEHGQSVVQGIAQSLTDLLMLHNAETSNRLADLANGLTTQSNQIATIANTANVRMLGLTYLTLVLAFLSAVILFPNTGATILGMPSAAWVPGLWVDVILVILGAVPFAVVFTRPWIRRMLHDLADSEMRSQEGMKDLPELTASEAARPVRPGRP